MLIVVLMWVMVLWKFVLFVNFIVNFLCQQVGFIKGQVWQVVVQFVGVVIVDVYQQVVFLVVVGKKCCVDFFLVKIGYWFGVEVQCLVGKNQICCLQGVVVKCGFFCQLWVGGKLVVGVIVGKQGWQLVVEGVILCYDGGYWCLYGFLQIVVGECWVKFFFVFCVVYEYDVCW